MAVFLQISLCCGLFDHCSLFAHHDLQVLSFRLRSEIKQHVRLAVSVIDIIYHCASANHANSSKEAGCERGKMMIIICRAIVGARDQFELQTSSAISGITDLQQS